MIGELKVSQENVSSSILEEAIVITNRTLNITTQLHDPSHAFEKAKISYKWSVDGHPSKVQSYIMKQNFTVPKIYNVSATLTVEASLKGGKPFTVYGTFVKAIAAKDQVKNISVDGLIWIPRYKNLNLTVHYLGGSPPFWYCYQIVNHPNESSLPNNTCAHLPIYTNMPYFNVGRYFKKDGKYSLLLSAGNQVSSLLNRHTEISIFEVPHQMQLSVVIIPITSCILALCIVVAAIAYHLKYRATHKVEVADFDFTHQASDDLDEKSFFERIHESFSASFNMFGNSLAASVGARRQQRPFYTDYTDGGGGGDCNAGDDEDDDDIYAATTSER